MRGPESALVDQCRLVAEAMSAFLAVVGQRDPRKSGSTLGFPDAVVFCAGHAEFVEFKDAKTGRLSLGQKVFIERVAEQGIKVHVVDRVDDFVAVVNGCRRKVRAAG